MPCEELPLKSRGWPSKREGNSSRVGEPCPASQRKASKIDVTDIHAGVSYPTGFAPLEQSLITLTPQQSLVAYHPRPPRRRALHPSPV